jgi:hypothetical protein
MEEHIIYDEDGKGFTRAYIGTDIEFADPIKYYSENEIEKHKTEIKDLLFMKNAFLASQLNEDFFTKNALKHWDDKLNEINNTVVPDNFLHLLDTTTKADQIKLLKGQSLTPEQLIAFIFKAWTGYGFTFSQYTAEHHHKGLDESQLPTLIHIEDDKVKTVGETSLTEGQLKNVIEHRKVIVAKFFDKGDNWHCLFVTFNSLAGKENWQGGQPHFHYISDKFGLTREDVVNRIKSGNYASTPVHIPLLDYR